MEFALEGVGGLSFFEFSSLYLTFRIDTPLINRMASLGIQTLSHNIGNNTLRLDIGNLLRSVNTTWELNTLISKLTIAG
jgi:hypothetical protein